MKRFVFGVFVLFLGVVMFVYFHAHWYYRDPVDAIPQSTTDSMNVDDKSSPNGKGADDGKDTSNNLSEEYKPVENKDVNKKKQKKQNSTQPNTANKNIDKLVGKIYGGMVGLQNLGNTCYMNASLQMLIHEVVFVKMFLNWCIDKNISSTNKHVSRALFDLLLKISEMKTGSFSPADFRKVFTNKCVSFADTNQHDADEFFTSLFDELKQEGFDFLNLCKVETSKTLSCSKDKNHKTNLPVESSYVLRLQFPGTNEGKESIALNDLVNNYLAEECITENNYSDCFDCKNKFKLGANNNKKRVVELCDSCKKLEYCKKCKVVSRKECAKCKSCGGDSEGKCFCCNEDHKYIKRCDVCGTCLNSKCKQCTKKHYDICSINYNTMTKQITHLNKISNMLIIQLVRFRYNPANGKMSKITDKVSIPEYLTLTTRDKIEHKYKLKGMIYHFGDLSGGHYVYYSYNEGSWRVFNDSGVSEQTPDLNANGNAYIIEYATD